MTSVIEGALHGNLQRIAVNISKAVDTILQHERKQDLIGRVAVQAQSARKVVTEKVELHRQGPPAEILGALTKSANARPRWPKS